MEGPVSQAFVFCPETGNLVYTGLNLEWFGLDTLEIGKQEFICPQCGKRHDWTADDLILRSDGAG